LSRSIDEDATHRLRRGAKKMSAVLPPGLLIAAQPQPGFMYEVRRLQGRAWLFHRHLAAGDPTQLFVNKTQQSIVGAGSRVVHCIERLGNLVQSDSRLHDFAPAGKRNVALCPGGRSRDEPSAPKIAIPRVKKSEGDFGLSRKNFEAI
jgi:hypothetical protein